MAENVTDNNVTCSVEEISNIIDENFFVDEDEEENDSLDDGNEEAIPSEMECVVDDTNLKATQDKLEDDAIMYHGGWAFRRARDEIMKGPDVIPIRGTLDSATYTEVQNSKVLAIIKSLRKDKKSEDGKIYFYPEQDLLAVFKFLHVKSSTLLKANIEQADSKAVI